MIEINLPVRAVLDPRERRWNSLNTQRISCSRRKGRTLGGASPKRSPGSQKGVDTEERTITNLEKKIEKGIFGTHGIWYLLGGQIKKSPVQKGFEGRPEVF